MEKFSAYRVFFLKSRLLPFSYTYTTLSRTQGLEFKCVLNSKVILSIQLTFFLQPFLTPVSPHSLSNIFLPLRVIIGILRSTLILVLFLLYLLLVPPLTFLLASRFRFSYISIH